MSTADFAAAAVAPSSTSVAAAPAAAVLNAALCGDDRLAAAAAAELSNANLTAVLTTQGMRGVPDPTVLLWNHQPHTRP